MVLLRKARDPGIYIYYTGLPLWETATVPRSTHGVAALSFSLFLVIILAFIPV